MVTDCKISKSLSGRIGIIAFVAFQTKLTLTGIIELHQEGASRNASVVVYTLPQVEVLSSLDVDSPHLVSWAHNFLLVGTYIQRLLKKYEFTHFELN